MISFSTSNPCACTSSSWSLLTTMLIVSPTFNGMVAGAGVIVLPLTVTATVRPDAVVLGVLVVAPAVVEPVAVTELGAVVAAPADGEAAEHEPSAKATATDVMEANEALNGRLIGMFAPFQSVGWGARTHDTKKVDG